MADVGDWTGRARKGRAQPGQVESGIRQLAAGDRPCGRTGETLLAEIGDGVKRGAEVVQQMALEGHRRVLDTMVPRVQQVLRQTKARIYRGDTRSVGKIVSIFEPSAEVIRKGKAAKPTEFGKLVKLQEAENQIVVDYEVYARRPPDADLLIPAIEIHAAKLGRVPRLVAADAGFHSNQNQAAARAQVSSASASPTTAAGILAASVSRRSDGSATGSDGAPDARDASVSASVDMACSVAAIVVTMA